MVAVRPVKMLDVFGLGEQQRGIQPRLFHTQILLEHRDERTRPVEIDVEWEHVDAEILAKDGEWYKFFGHQFDLMWASCRVQKLPKSQ